MVMLGHLSDARRQLELAASLATADASVSSDGSPVLSPVQITHLVRENFDLKEQLERQRESAHVVESFIGA